MNDFLNNVDKYEIVVIVALQKDDSNDIGHSEGRPLTKAGLCGLGELHFLDKVMGNAEEDDKI